MPRNAVRQTSLLVSSVVAIALTTPAFAAVEDYEFQLTRPRVKLGDGVIIAVRLLDKRTKSLVPKAVIVAKQMDMRPDGMATMSATLTEVPSEAPGEYRFKTDLWMLGRWQLSIEAKVQGEDETIQRTLVIRTLP